VRSGLASFATSTTTWRAQFPAPSQLRDRFDFTISNESVGLYDKQGQTLVDLHQCPQQSPALAEAWQKVRPHLPSVKKGSVRVRVGPQQEIGVWLDLAHKDVQELFAKPDKLQSLLAIAHVEIGQRRKHLRWDSEQQRLRLADPQYKIWSDTQVNGKSHPLLGLVGSFTQVGHRASRVLMQEYQRMLDSISPQHFLEFGSGNGNLTLPALAKTKSGVALESDQLATRGLKLTLQGTPEQERLRIGTQLLASETLKSFDLLILNPPRSGIQGLAEVIRDCPQPELPRTVFYMSCYFSSLLQDAKLLQGKGYQLAQVALVDQFPQTHHFELLTLWTK